MMRSSARPRLLVLALLAATVASAGCFGAGDDALADPAVDPAGGATPGANNAGNGTAAPPATGGGPSSPTGNVSRPGGSDAPAASLGVEGVVAVIDSGINPYHLVFRDASALAQQHPSTYIAGYPADAKALRLTFNASSYADAREADKAVWDGVAKDVLYYVPGTRIIGIYSTEVDGTIPGLDEQGHGTMTASRAIGAGTSLGSGARIVAIEGLNAASVRWSASQPWIDAQSNSWSACIGVGVPATCTKSIITEDVTRALTEAATKQLVLAAAGNGLFGYAGVVGMPAFTSPNAGAPGVIAVGGHDNGDITTWTGAAPHVVADACDNPAADYASLDRVANEIGSGTSSATPYVAGAAMRILLDARAILASGVLPSTGPLADGAFDLAEWKTLVLHTADPRPPAGEHDGDNCSIFLPPYPTAPIAWRDVPEGVSATYFIGYGGVDAATVATASRVLRGEIPAPDRADEDDFFATEGTVRDLY